MRTVLGRVVATLGRPCRRGPGLWTAVPVSALLVCALASAAAAGVRPTLVAAGEAHSCVLTRGGTVLCWGANASGQLGDGSTTQRLTPVAVIGLTNAETSIVAGQSHTCAITTGGGVVCWGENGDGQLGNNSTTDSPTPVQVSGLTSGVTALAGGGITPVRFRAASSSAGGATPKGKWASATTPHRSSRPSPSRAWQPGSWR